MAHLHQSRVSWAIATGALLLVSCDASESESKTRRAIVLSPPTAVEPRPASPPAPLQRRVEEPGISRPYLVQFAEPPVPLRPGRTAGSKLDLRAPANQVYRQELRERQDARLASIFAAVEVGAVLATYQLAIDGVALQLTPEAAQRVRKMPGVVRVTASQRYELDTDRGPAFVGAEAVWAGVQGATPTAGEGKVVGVIDTGAPIALESGEPHPSFSTVSGDGYVHSNPLGKGTYLGGCVENPTWCTDKLIGVHNNLVVENGVEPFPLSDDSVWSYKDLQGHGSMVASIAAGNVVESVAWMNRDGSQVQTESISRLSGVAPRANVVSYKACSLQTCYDINVVDAVEQAIEDGVIDVLNHSISAGQTSPWENVKTRAFLAARAAGIYVVDSVGNSGPDVGTVTTQPAPWSTTVGAVTHDRRYHDHVLTTLQGAEPGPVGLTGRGVTGAFEGRLIDARNVRVGVPGETGYDEPEICMGDYPPGTFTSDEIVMCDYGGAIDRLRAARLLEGGAGGALFVGAENFDYYIWDEPFVLPGLRIDYSEGAALRAWLADGDEHRVSFESSLVAPPDASESDRLYWRTSRGPYVDTDGRTYDIATISVVAPGWMIYGAGPADDTVPIDDGAIAHGAYQLGTGTSYATPHVAGAAALVMAARPEWGLAEVQSALMTTATDAVTDMVDPSVALTPQDIGSGRIDVEAAVRAGLLLDETAEGFEAADPAAGGDPQQLNVANLYDDACLVVCTWTRTVTATAAATWTVTTDSDAVAVLPSTFSLEAGESQLLTIVVDADTPELESRRNARVRLTPNDDALAEQSLPITFNTRRSDLPSRIFIEADADQGTATGPQVRSIAVTDVTTGVWGLAPVVEREVELSWDRDPISPYDDLRDGVDVQSLAVAPGARIVVAEISAPEAEDGADFDLFVGLDYDGDGLPSEDEEVCVRAVAGNEGSCVVDLSEYPRVSEAWVVTQAWWLPGRQDTVEVTSAVIESLREPDLLVSGPRGPRDALDAYPLDFAWDRAMAVGERYFAWVDVYAAEPQEADGFLGSTLVDLRRVEGEPHGSTGADSDTDASDSSSGGDDTTGRTSDGPAETSDTASPGDETSADDGSSGAGGGSVDDSGCGCTSAPLPSAPGGLVLLMGLGALRRRRRSRSIVGARLSRTRPGSTRVPVCSPERSGLGLPNEEGG